MKRNTLSALLALLGAVCLVVCNVAIERHAVAPVPVHRLGLPSEAVEPFREFVASLPPLQIVGAASDADNQSKRVVLDSHLLRVGGGKWPWHGPQETGDCAAMSIAGAIEIDTAVQSEQDPEIIWRPVDRGAIYGGGRVTIGKGAIKGAGLVPSWGLQYVDGFGILWQDQPDVPPYSGRRMDEWGRNGVPAKFLDLMKPFAGLEFAACRSAQDVCNAINAGCPVPFGSMRWGTDRIKLVEGRNLAFDTTDWPHAEIATGYDGTLANGQRLFRVLNSWGPNAHSPKSQMPGDHPGGYYVTWETMDAICREGMTFAISGANGFRQRQFVPDFSVIGAAGPLPDVSEKESAIMLPLLSPDVQIPGSVLGCACLLAAVSIMLFRGSGVRRLGVVALLGVASLPQMALAQTPDFEALTQAAQSTKLASVSESGAVFELLTVAATRPVAQSPDFTILTKAACECSCGVQGCSCSGDCQISRKPAGKPAVSALSKLLQDVDAEDEARPMTATKPKSPPTEVAAAPPNWNGCTSFYWPSVGAWKATPEPGTYYPTAGGVLVPAIATTAAATPAIARPPTAGRYVQQRVCVNGTCSLQNVWVP